MYDKNTLDKIFVILGDEKRTLEQIVSLQEKKCNLLIEDQYPQLQQLDEEEATLVNKLNALEKERLFTGNTMLDGRSSDTLKDLINAVPDEDKEKLIQVQHSLNAVIQRLTFLKSVTQSILKDKQKLVDLSLAEAEGSNTEYDAKGSVKSVASKNNSVLVNKSI